MRMLLTGIETAVLTCVAARRLPLRADQSAQVPTHSCLVAEHCSALSCCLALRAALLTAAAPLHPTADVSRAKECIRACGDHITACLAMRWSVSGSRV